MDFDPFPTRDRYLATFIENKYFCQFLSFLHDLHLNENLFSYCSSSKSLDEGSEKYQTNSLRSILRKLDLKDHIFILLHISYYIIHYTFTNNLKHINMYYYTYLITYIT